MEKDLSRREILKGLAALPFLPLVPLAAQDSKDDPYGGFKMSLATYSLREFPIAKALEHLKGLDVRYAEINPAHLAVAADKKKIEEAQSLLKQFSVTPYAYGVFYTERFKEDRKKAIENVFALAKTLGLKVISCDIEEDWLGTMEEFASKNEIRLGLHNHGPKSRYPTTEKLLKAIEGRHENVGVTLDVGHLMNSGENPVDAVEKLGKRVHGCHLKDKKDKELSVILGTGELDLVGLLKALRKAKFDGALSLEYERNAKNPIDDIRACLEAVRSAVKKL